MKTRLVGWIAMVAVSIIAAGQTHAQPSRAEPTIEPDAMAALQKMGAYLRSLKAFQVEATTSEEDVLTDGQKVQSSGVVNLLARMPDRLRIDVDNERHDRMFIYDGKTMTLLARRVNYYATVPAPATIAQLADAMDQQYNLQLPLEDLFRWGGPQSQDDAITSAMFIGPSEIGGVSCGHYAFRQKGLDWQVWIQFGEFPLPRKLALTTLTDEARPQYVATFNWNLAPSFDDRSFVFVPPAGAGKAVVAAVR